VNLPENSKEYLHRAGRCGRNGQQGICISIITENELAKIKSYQKEFNINMVQKKLYQCKLVSK
jgi:superfamily II DNA/RNA helicase